MASPRICLVVPYFGRWPFWMPFFLQSCRYNPSIDWLFFSDCETPANCPPNVRIEHLSFSDYCAQVSERLGIDFAPASPYKLCDLKPALGYVHADRLEGYDFWGFSDIDLVYGNLRQYFTDERLSRYDLYSTHARRVSGHFCLLRNTRQMREVFMKVPDWQRLLADKAHLSFDEKDFTRLFIRCKNWPESLRRLVDLCNPLRRRSEFVEAFTTPNTRLRWIDGSLRFPRQWIWDRGSLRNDLDGDREVPYFHFIKWKSDPWGGLPKETWVGLNALASQPCWSISEGGFHDCPALCRTA